MMYLRKFNETLASYMSDSALYKKYEEIPVIIKLKNDLDPVVGLARFKEDLDAASKKATFEISHYLELYSNGTEIYTDAGLKNLVIAIVRENELPGSRRDFCYKKFKFNRNWYTFRLVSKKISNFTEAFLMVYVDANFVNKFLKLSDDDEPTTNTTKTTMQTTSSRMVPRYNNTYVKPVETKKVSIDEIKEVLVRLKNKRK